jgi:RimK family alpha-L-glutamate ligase
MTTAGIFSGLPPSQAADRIAAEFGHAGCEVRWIPSDAGPAPDLTVTRLLGEEPDLSELLVILDDLASANSLGRIFNGPLGLGIALSKWRQAEAFERGGVPYEPVLRVDPATAGELGGIVGWPVVVKPDHGLMGRGVTRFDEPGALRRHLEAATEPLVCQRFVPEASQTIRAIVTADAVLAAAIRTAAPGDWRANVAQGAAMTATELADAEVELAVLATRTCGLDIAGVDLVRTSRGTIVLEVNPSPGLLGIESVCGNVARRIVDAVLTAAGSPA